MPIARSHGRLGCAGSSPSQVPGQPRLAGSLAKLLSSVSRRQALLLQVSDATGQAGEEAGRVSPGCDFEVVQPLPFDVIRVNVGDHKSERGPIARGGLWL